MMNITDPSALHPAWAERFNAQDLDGIMSFAEPNGTFVPQPGLPLTGSDNLAAQRQFLAFGLPITLTVRHTLVAGDVALAIVDWSMKGTAPDGTEVDMGGTAADVLRKGDDGWKLAIDNPFGTA
jgi:ketosteroid isomerase-like protein